MLRNRSKGLYPCPTSEVMGQHNNNRGLLPTHTGRQNKKRRGSPCRVSTKTAVGVSLVCTIVIGGLWICGYWRGHNYIKKRRAVIKSHHHRPALVKTATRSPIDEIFDIAVLGAGPAGLTAALFGARAGLSVNVFGSETGLLSETPRLDNFPSFRSDLGGPAWLEATKEQAILFGATFAQAGLLVSKLKRDEDKSFFVLDIPGQPSVKAWSTIVATGAKPRRLNLPQEETLWGKSLHSCAICDGNLYVDKKVCVVGGGDAAVDASILLARYAKEVVLIHRRDELKASNQVSIDIMRETSNINILTPFTAEQWMTDQTKLTGAVLKRNDGKKESKTVSCDGAFLMIGATPNTEWIKGQVELDGDGFVRLEDESATSLSGVFAAGEVADTVYRQAITAAAAGAQAAIDAERWLRKTRGVKKVVKSQTGVEKLNMSTTTVQRNMEERVDKDIECDLISASCIKTVVKKYPVVVFSKPWCPYCKRAIEALSIEGVTKPYIVDLASFGPKGPAIQDTLQKMTGRRTVPNVFIGGNSIGGGDETTAMQREGKLGPLLKTVGAL